MEKSRTRVTHVRLNDDELQRFKAASSRLGIKPSRLHRKIIREASGCGPDMLVEEFKPVRDTARQLGAIGRNLNQITKKINSGELVPEFDVQLVEDLADYVDAATKAVQQVVTRSHNRWVPNGDE